MRNNFTFTRNVIIKKNFILVGGLIDCLNESNSLFQIYFFITSSDK